MEVTTRLTWLEEKILKYLLGNASLTLLYKSSVHKPCVIEMTKKCSHQGSTMTVVHLEQDVVGVFMLEHFLSEKPSACVWFSFEKNKSSGISSLFLNTLETTVKSPELRFSSPYGLSLTIDPSKRKLHLNKVVIKALGLNLDMISQYLECEIFRVDVFAVYALLSMCKGKKNDDYTYCAGPRIIDYSEEKTQKTKQNKNQCIKNDPGFIKKMVTAKQHRGKLLSALREYRPYKDLVSEVRILLVGPVGSGKSSFFNSVKSAFQGHLTRQATVGSDESGITKQYRMYSLKCGESGERLRFMLCDSMGLDEREEEGLNIEDIPNILNGCVPDRYQFNPSEPIQPKHFAYVTSPPLKDRIHCVAFVLDINSVNTLSDKMVAKLKKIHKDVVDCGVGHVALLTNVANYDEVLDCNFLNMTESMTSKSQVKTVQTMLNIPIANILMVRNYASERRLEPMKDVLIFAVLRHMLRAADDALEELPPEDTASADGFVNDESHIKNEVEP